MILGERRHAIDKPTVRNGAVITGFRRLRDWHGMSGTHCIDSCSELCLDDSFSVDNISSLANGCLSYSCLPVMC